MALSPEEKQERARNRMIEKAREYTPGTYIRKYVAPVFQQMIRAEYAARPSGVAWVVQDGQMSYVQRSVGQCACVTCGKVKPWKGSYGDQMHTGHFLASRRNSILFEEANVAPQCNGCNGYHGGAPQAYRMWMEHIRGQDEIDRLKRLKNEVRTFSRDELVDMRIEYQARLKAAIERMERP